MIGSKGKGLAVSGRTGPLLAAMLVLLAVVFGWSAVQQWRQANTGTQLEQARDTALQGLQRALDGQLLQFGKHLQSARVQQSLQAGDASAAALALREGWTGVEDAQVWPASLDAAYADPQKFGYARLALLEAALRAEVPVARVVRDGDGARLGLAARMQTDNGPMVAYVRQPLMQLTGPLAAVQAPDAGYLALRQGSFNVLERGNRALADSGEVLARPISNSSLRLAAGVPSIEPGPLGLGPLAASIVCLLLVLIAVLLLVGRSRLPLLPVRGARMPAEEQGPTLSESLALSAAEAPDGPATGDASGAAASPPAAAATLAAGIFRAYDIRGVVGEELTPKVAALIGQAIGSEVVAQGLREVVIGRDGRLSGPELAAGLAEGLRRAGCDVIDIGLAPTPVVYFASHHLRAGSCVAVTGSHNPPEYNGFKIVIAGQTLSGDAVTALHQRIVEGRLALATSPGGYQQRDVNEDYVRRIADDVQLERPLKVVADAGNGVAGALVQPLLEAIGADVIPLYCDVDGTFPNHHPDPSVPDNLQDLVQTVKRFGADLGVAFDGDGDRLGVVTPDGTIIFADRLLMLFAADVLLRNPGAMVIYDVKCTGRLADFVLRHGGSPMMWKTGHSLIKAKMAETDAELAGEMSGHFFFRERWFGFDDGLYAAARLLEILALREETPQEVLEELPQSVATPEIKVPVANGTPHALVSLVVGAVQAPDGPFAGGRVSTIDGLRVDFADGWGLVRASNTTPVLVLRFEADTEEALERIKTQFRDQLQPLFGEQDLGF
ncbi:phosphomannomutase/phosphoglucomutase [Stenotrophomonas tumulicola]|uniref:phosphomannomutase n=1 Tax=Stenotrophomonas tumulicola TaxID=1685415 RepID=A0A7W3FQH8_9GAMM|nr:phosphomannomutase/phosphoglucomutase [Stenotrophomonas tumulicola]